MGILEKVGTGIAAVVAAIIGLAFYIGFPLGMVYLAVRVASYAWGQGG